MNKAELKDTLAKYKIPFDADDLNETLESKLRAGLVEALDALGYEATEDTSLNELVSTMEDIDSEKTDEESANESEPTDEAATQEELSTEEDDEKAPDDDIDTNKEELSTEDKSNENDSSDESEEDNENLDEEYTFQKRRQFLTEVDFSDDGNGEFHNDIIGVTVTDEEIESLSVEQWSQFMDNLESELPIEEDIDDGDDNENEEGQIEPVEKIVVPEEEVEEGIISRDTSELVQQLDKLSKENPKIKVRYKNNWPYVSLDAILSEFKNDINKHNVNKGIESDLEKTAKEKNIDFVTPEELIKDILALAKKMEVYKELKRANAGKFPVSLKRLSSNVKYLRKIAKHIN